MGWVRERENHFSRPTGRGCERKPIPRIRRFVEHFRSRQRVRKGVKLVAERASYPRATGSSQIYDFHLRFVQWRSFFVRRSKRWRGHRDEKEQLELVDFQSGNVFSRYYFQDESDQGVMMETTVPTKEVRRTRTHIYVLRL